MTDLITAEARKTAAEAAARSGVRVEQVHDLELLRTVRDVIDEVWRPEPDDRPLTLGVLRAMTHSGNYCALAWDGTEPVGVCVGFLAIDTQLTLHSHIAGIVPRATGRNIGRALKLDQRAWALDHGVGTVTWTFDPLIRRNAWFNASRLGALPSAYHVDFYGDMTDAINAGQFTDRLSVTWQLASTEVVDICAGRPPAGFAPTPIVLAADPASGEPVRHDDVGADTVRVGLPDDVEAMRVADPDLARRWRFAVRDVLGGHLGDGWRVVGVEREGFYVLTDTTGDRS